MILIRFGDDYAIAPDLIGDLSYTPETASGPARAAIGRRFGGGVVRLEGEAAEVVRRLIDRCLSADEVE